MEDKQEARPETGNEESLGLTEKLADLNLEEKKENEVEGPHFV